MDSFKNPIGATDNQSLGVAIQKLIEDNVKRINTSFLARIESINGGGLVDVVDIINQRDDIDNAVIPNAIYGVPSSSLWQVSHNAKVGDIGLAIVIKSDINIYKSNKKGGKPTTKRLFNENDCIFIPLTLLNYPSTDDYSIKSSDNKIKINLTNDSINLTTEKSNIELKDKINLTSDSVDIISNNGDIEVKSSKGITLQGGGGSLSDLMEAVITYVSACQFGAYPYNAGTSKVAETAFKATIKKFEKGGI